MSCHVMEPNSNHSRARHGEIPRSTAATLRELKANDEDLSWYPTTNEIIQQVADDIVRARDGYQYTRVDSVLDIGAGDGRVLKGIQKAVKEADRFSNLECYAIEKSIVHQSNMPKDITIIGTDFHEQTLVDKKVGAVFCNPPYSEFAEWTLKIVREASTGYIYLVIPVRWRQSVEIQHALQARSGKVESLGEFDFEDADRKARARVEVVRIRFKSEHQDAFDSCIKDMLPELDIFDIELEEEKSVAVSEEMLKANQNLVEVLVDGYDKAMLRMLENYQATLKIDRRVLSEIGVTKDSVLGSIKMKIKGMKDKYWKALFDEMATITQRLATKQRAAFLESLKNKVAIDFTANNVYSVLIWISKWANDYFDQQLIELFRTLSNDSNVVKYKSNERVWVKTGWRYGKDYDFSGDANSVSHYKLEYRMVLTHGGISTSQWEHERREFRGLDKRSVELLKDIVTVANNLGFACNDAPKNYEWKSNKQNVLTLTNGEPLVAVRAFKNGNMHLHFNPKVMLAINVEAGRLLKWIRNPQEACEELDVQGDEAKQVAALFGSSFRIGTDAGLLRLSSNTEAA